MERNIPGHKCFDTLSKYTLKEYLELYHASYFKNQFTAIFIVSNIDKFLSVLCIS